MRKILVVDDEANVHYSFRKVFENEYEIISAENGADGIAKLAAESPDVILMDIKMPGMSGLEALKKMKQARPRAPIIIMTAHSTMGNAIEAMKHGAYEYVVKPFDVPTLKELIKKAANLSDRSSRNVSPLTNAAHDFIVGNSTSMQKVYKTIGQIAEKDVTVLIRGESGTGKELIARAIYQNSLRAPGAFVAVNCASIPETLLESELFGHEKGSFTGATERRLGRFEQADRGTIFLDEIGSMSLTTQGKILRVLQESEFNRLGGKEVIKVNVRVLTATNADLEGMIRAGTFRDDLYYRLNVISIMLPPLRERLDDIGALADYFIRRYSKEVGKDIRGISGDGLEKLKSYGWPGNVRELENCIKRAVLLSKGSVIMPEDIITDAAITGAKAAQAPAGGTVIEQAVDELFRGDKPANVSLKVEKMLIIKALEKTRGNQVKAAQMLGMSRNTIRSRIKKYGINLDVKVKGKEESK